MSIKKREGELSAKTAMKRVRVDALSSKPANGVNDDLQILLHHDFGNRLSERGGTLLFL